MSASRRLRARSGGGPATASTSTGSSSSGSARPARVSPQSADGALGLRRGTTRSVIRGIIWSRLPARCATHPHGAIPMTIARPELRLGRFMRRPLTALAVAGLVATSVGACSTAGSPAASSGVPVGRRRAEEHRRHLLGSRRRRLRPGRRQGDGHGPDGQRRRPARLVAVGEGHRGGQQGVDRRRQRPRPGGRAREDADRGREGGRARLPRADHITVREMAESAQGHAGEASPAASTAPKRQGTTTSTRAAIPTSGSTRSR